MSEATYVPILPDMRKFFSETSKGSRKAGAQAGRDFADGMAREVSRAEKAVDAAARTQERAAARATDATNKRRLEEQKLNEVLEKGTAKASEIMAATQRYEKAQRDEAQAAKNAEKAVQGLERAKRDLNQVTDETSDAVRVGADNLEGFGDAAKGAAGRVGELVAAGAGIAGFGALVSTGMDMSGALSKMNAQLGASGVVAEQNAEAVASALRSGVASGADEAAEAVGALTAQIDGLGSGGEKGAAELSRPLLAFTKTFEVDMAEATQTVGQLLQNDLASDATEAFDLMTTAMQRVPVAMRDELPEVINEYGTHFRGLGFSGEEAFGLLVSAADKGKWALDKTGDALKEFQIRASDGSTATANAYAAIGEDAEAMAVSVAAGGESARLALEYTAESLLAVEDPAERAQHAIALFGTPLEDLSVDQIPQFLEGLTGADEAMAGFQGSSEDLADIVANSLPGRLDALKGTVTDLAGDGFMYLWDSAVKVSDWARDNQSWLTPLIVGFGTLAGIIGGIAVAQNLWNAALGVYRTIQAIATGQQLLFNAALLANPITWVVAALAGLVAGLVYFFTQTETGRKAWDTFTSALVAGWNWLSGVLTAGWEIIKATVFDAWNTTVEWTQEKWSQVANAVSNTWTWLKDQLYAGYTWVKSNVFDAMTSALDTVKGWFSTTVDTIGTTWEKLRALTAKPVRFVVETVYGGIRNAWNKIAGLVGLGELPEVSLGALGNYARGGVLPGYTPGRDVHTFVSPTGGTIHLSGGEAIMRPEVTRALGTDKVDALNSAARFGGVDGVRETLGRFAGGGVIGSITGLVRKHFPMMTITSAYRPGDPGHHGTGNAVDFSNGTDTTPQMQAATAWFAQNYGGQLLELIHSPSPYNIKNGRSVGDGFGFYGAGTMNAHRNHVHVAAASPLGDVGGGGVLGVLEGAFTSMADMAKGAWDKAIGAIGKFPGADTMGTIGKLPAAALSTLADGAWDFLSSKLSAVAGGFGGGGGEQYRSQIEAAFRNQGETPHKHLVDALIRQINSESGGDPNVAQQIVDVNGTGPSAGLGLYQFIPSTFAAYRDPSLPNDRTDPWSAHNAAVRYFRDRHGWNTGPGGVGRGHGWKSGGVLPADLTTLFDTGGVWPSGTAGVNLSGADEYVFTNRAMRDFRDATESLRLSAEDISKAVDAGVDAAASVWAAEAPTQDDWIQAGWDFLGMGDSLTAGLIRRGGEFSDLVGKYESEMNADTVEPAVSTVDPIPVAAPSTTDTPSIETPSLTGDGAGGESFTAAGGDGLTVVVNLDGVEVFRERVERVEDDVVEIDKELDSLKRERRGLDAAANVLLS